MGTGGIGLQIHILVHLCTLSHIILHLLHHLFVLGSRNVGVRDSEGDDCSVCVCVHQGRPQMPQVSRNMERHCQASVSYGRLGIWRPG